MNAKDTNRARCPVKDLLVRRVYTHENGISITVEIDYVKKSVSLVKKDGSPKNFKFAERTPEYLNGWRAIMLAMEAAVAEVQKEFEVIKDKEHKALVEMYMALDKALKKGEGDPDGE